MTKLNSISEIYAALDEGKRVYWSNTSYEVKAIYNRPHLNRYTVRLKDGIEQQLDCRCISNYFGGLLQPNEVGQCFVLSEDEGGAL